MPKMICSKCGEPMSASEGDPGKTFPESRIKLCKRCEKKGRRSSGSGHKRPSSSNEKISTKKKGLRKTGRPSKSTADLISIKEKDGSERKHSSQVDLTFGENLARVSGSYKPRGTSAFRVHRDTRHSKRHAYPTQEPVSKKQWKYILMGTGLLGVAFCAILLFPQGTTVVGPDPQPVNDTGSKDPLPHQAGSGEEELLSSNAFDKNEKDPGGAGNPETPPERQTAPPEPDEYPVLLMSDLDVSAEVRADRRSWRLEHGSPKPGSSRLLLGGFENAVEILYWTFRPRNGIEAWLGNKGVTSGGHSIRLKIAPVPGFSETFFQLVLGQSEFWNWKQAQELSCDVFNPTTLPLTLHIQITYDDGTKEQMAEWPFTLQAHSEKHLTCSIQDTKISFDQVMGVGFRIPHLKKRALVFYIDNFALKGAFGDE